MICLNDEYLEVEKIEGPLMVDELKIEITGFTEGSHGLERLFKMYHVTT